MLKDLASLSDSEIKSFLDSFDIVLCDCDGVVWKLNNPIPGVKDTLTKLRELGKQIRFVSNNCSYRMEDFQKKLNNCHFDVQLDNTAFPTLAIISYLKKINFKKEIYLFGFPAMRQEFLKAGFKLAHSGPDRIEERIDELPSHFKDNEEVGAVIIDIDLNINYIKLLKAMVYLQRSEVLFITGGADTKVPMGFNIMLIGPRYFRNILEDFSDRKALAFGKPSKNFNDFIVENFNIEDPSRTLFVGDR
ncbi:hypothetical protein ILUMI_01816 [Ignelater luminosus]|uniref:4-nitrophenylphosphatase n=1 Tax=Ignelater luminosus TaxID=2038154 RepID=A0A8K0DDU9_IGNLU|nr:hypothetical protein ILUMI_01816 [Ignelater luminosus]